ncbi:MAG: salicylate hydroxylase [Limisphaerales bacterium]
MKVLIAGAGIGGITTALCLAQSGHAVEIFEQASELSEIGAGIQLSPNCTRVLHHLGLENALLEHAFLPQGTEFRAWKTGRTISSRPLGKDAVARYGFPYYHIHRGDLLGVLAAATRQTPAITLNLNTRIEGFAEQNQQVQIQTNDQNFSGDLLIGADGIHSVIRTGLWGEEQPVFTGNIAWRALVPAEKLPPDLIRPMSTAWWGPQKHFVHYYVRGGSMVNCVCVVEKTGWQVESWNEQGDYEELKSDFTGWHSDIQLLIDRADGDSLFKWALFDRPPMNAWGKGRVTLLGDACHPTLPFMAQGAAMAIEDSAVLAACLNEGDDVTLNLKHYENLRRARTAGIQNGSRRNARIFHLSGIPAWLRNRAASRAGGKTMDDLFSYNALDANKRDPVN